MSLAHDGAPTILTRWHALVATPDRDVLSELLAEDVAFRSPAVHKPMTGREVATQYLWAALQVLGPTVTYVHQWWDESSAVLRFTATVDDREVEGVDMLHWNEDGRIDEFTVMARPFSGLQTLIAAMAAELGLTAPQA
jgi:hypothetical protein